MSKQEILASQAAALREALRAVDEVKSACTESTLACHNLDTIAIRALITPDASIALQEQLEAARLPLQEAIANLLAKLDQVEQDTKGIFVMAHIHGQNYKGANWSKEYEAAKAALRASREPKG